MRSRPDVFFPQPSKRSKVGTCPLCHRHIELTFHHFIPKKMHRREFFKKHFSKEELQQGVDICRLCHDGIHDLYDEMRLAKEFCSFEALAADAALQRHCAWVAKQRVPGP